MSASETKSETEVKTSPANERPTLQFHAALLAAAIDGKKSLVTRQTKREQRTYRCVYISGPMTGFPAYNIPAFTAAEKMLRERGLDVVNPATLNKKEHVGVWNVCMRNDISHLPRCDAILMLPGWEQSSGAVCERTVAMMLQIDDYTEEEENAPISSCCSSSVDSSSDSASSSGGSLPLC